MNKKKINFSFELLRLLLSLWVVNHHCYKEFYKYKKALFHVPTFMIMSFYFYCNTLKAKDVIKIKQRFQRILIPYIIWPILIIILNNILFKLPKFHLYNKKLLLNDLVIQLIFGQKYHNIFYYQFNLIFLTILFTIISFLLNKSLVFILQISLIIAYISQYSYWNIYTFKKYSVIIKYSLGNILELLPFAVIGVILCHFNITRKLKKFKGLAIFYIGIILFLILKFEIFARIRGFYYPGVFLNIGGINIFILFSLFSIKNKIIIFLLKIITKFTGGIYYIHVTCFYLLQNKILFIKDKTFKGVIFIYITCYITCFLGNKISYKTKYKYLFN